MWVDIEGVLVSLMLRAVQGLVHSVVAVCHGEYAVDFFVVQCVDGSRVVKCETSGC